MKRKPINFLSARVKEITEKIREQRKAKLIVEQFNLIEPSLKQKKVMTWWREESPYNDFNGI
ncbi:hypothetical protein, partial [Cetobacterium sp.]|uniref:hypothetical protein n=1 Tax=Cetobacterium sp. TaxID=2071632 RepID=UPI003EE79F95